MHGIEIFESPNLNKTAKFIQYMTDERGFKLARGYMSGPRNLTFWLFVGSPINNQKAMRRVLKPNNTYVRMMRYFNKENRFPISYALR